jgi:uncharacterized cupredoxin-like copper-binding protein
MAVSARFMRVGCRKSIGFDERLDTAEQWGIDHSSDRRGDDQPPEEIDLGGLFCVKESSMFREGFVIDSRHQSYAFLQQGIGPLALLSAVLLSGLLYRAAGPVVAGEGPTVVVEVRLTEFTIEMPKTMPPGPVTFSVTNAGTMEHNFEIEGEGIEKKFDSNLKPGETRNLQVDLPAGTYRVYCPVKDHKDHGTQLEIKVAPQQANRAIRPGMSQVLLQAQSLAKW